jgi:hypothetical protein
MVLAVSRGRQLAPAALGWLLVLCSATCIHYTKKLELLAAVIGYSL